MQSFEWQKTTPYVHVVCCVLKMTNSDLKDCWLCSLLIAGYISVFKCMFIETFELRALFLAISLYFVMFALAQSTQHDTVRGLTVPSRTECGQTSPSLQHSIKHANRSYKRSQHKWQHLSFCHASGVSVRHESPLIASDSSSSRKGEKGEGQIATDFGARRRLTRDLPMSIIYVRGSNLLCMGSSYIGFIVRPHWNRTVSGRSRFSL